MQPEISPLAVSLSNVSKWYGDFQVLSDINLTVEKGEKSSFVDHPVRENRR